MKLFNLDLHISVIADLKQIFGAFGHIVTDKCLSGHADIMHRNKDHYEGISGDKWTWLIYNWGFDAFWDAHRAEFDRYDAYIVTYPPVFSMLYAKSNKPIVVQIPIRFDHGMHGRPDLIQKYIDVMKPGVESGRIVFSANSLFDKAYFEGFSGLPCLHIPSLCEYTGLKYDGGTDVPLVYAPTEKNAAAIGGAWRHNLKRGFPWSALKRFRAIVHFPYQISTMSIFEQYTANIPLLFPSKKYLKEMYFGGWNGILEQVSNFKLHRNRPGSLMPFSGPVDPNDYGNAKTVDMWLDGADFYSEEWMPHILYFDSIEQVKRILSDVPLLRRTSAKMKEVNVWRREQVYSRWKEVLNGIQNKG